jgi:pteridine reductase
MSAVNLQGKLAIVTGGGRGLGRALVRALTAAGARVSFSYRESGDGAAAELERLRGTGATAHKADATVPGQMADFVERAAGDLGGVDILINNAGVFRRVPVGELTDAVLDEAWAVNVKAAVLASQAAAPHMRKRGSGSVVNVASLGGLRPWRNHLAYCSSKAALIMATQCLAAALAPDIRVNAVAPGILEPPGAGETVRERIPLRRFGLLDEAVEAVLFLAGGAAYTTGEVLTVDGGRRLA